MNNFRRKGLRWGESRFPLISEKQQKKQQVILPGMMIDMSDYLCSADRILKPESSRTQSLSSLRLNGLKDTYVKVEQPA